MARIARHEIVRVEGASVGNLHPINEQHFVVGGCNTDALGGVRVPASCRCIADSCAMWRWSEEAPEPREANCVYHEDDTVTGEPARPDNVPADYAWFPIVFEDGEAVEGGYWLEPQEAVNAENAAACSARRGFCGLAGRPEAF